jgi:hypothetical protein
VSGGLVPAPVLQDQRLPPGQDQGQLILCVPQPAGSGRDEPFISRSHRSGSSLPPNRPRTRHARTPE